MESIGIIFKKKRESNKLSLIKISKNLNISIVFLESIENDDFSNIPGYAYTMGYIRSYADFLNLNSDEIVQLYKDQVFYTNKKAAIEIKRPIDSFNFFLSYKLVSFFGVISLSFIFYFLFINEKDYFPKYVITPDVSYDIEAKIEEIELTNALSKLKKEKNELLNNKTKNIVLTNEKINKIKIDNTKAIASTDEKIFEDKITIRSLEPTWIQLRNSNDEIIYSNLMNSNDEYSYSIINNYSITAGNAGNLMISINGVVKGKLGKKGEVIEMLIISTDYFQ